MSDRIEELRLPKWEREKPATGTSEIVNEQENMKQQEWGQVTASPEGSKHKYDFDFMCLTFNMIPIYGGKGAIAPNAITDILYDKADDNWRVNMHGGAVYVFSHAEMAEFEIDIKRRQEDAKILKRENYKAELLMQVEVSQELLAEANGRVTPAHGQIVDPRGRRH